MNWINFIGALVLGTAMCNPSYGFEWLDRLIGIDLDNSEAPQYYPQVAPTYSPQATPTYRPYTAGYAPYSDGYPAAMNDGYRVVAPTQGALQQTGYRTVYQSTPVTHYQSVTTYDSNGYRVTTMRPVVTYQMQSRVLPGSANQPTYAPATNYAPATGGFSSGN